METLDVKVGKEFIAVENELHAEMQKVAERHKIPLVIVGHLAMSLATRYMAFTEYRDVLESGPLSEAGNG